MEWNHFLPGNTFCNKISEVISCHWSDDPGEELNRDIPAGRVREFEFLVSRGVR